MIIKRSRTLSLPQCLDAPVAATLATMLRACRGEDIVIDARHVRAVTPQGARVLRWATRAWNADRRSLTLVNGAAELVERSEAA
jgi:hypothetical protein